MNYIAAVNSFWDSATLNPLSTGQVSLYFALLHINNRSNWTEWFTAPNQVLSILTGLSRSGISKARNELRQRGIIDFRERGTKATLYKLLTIANSTQDSVQNSAQNSNQNSVQDSAQNGSTLYKHKQETKTKTKKKDTNVSKESGCGDDAALPEKQSGVRELFEYLWSLYPEKKGKAAVSESKKAEIAKAGKEQMERAIDRYKTEFEKDKSWRKPQYGSTFFNGGYVDYLDANFSPSERIEEPKTKGKNGFHNLEEHGYDYNEMMWNITRSQIDNVQEEAGENCGHE